MRPTETGGPTRPSRFFVRLPLLALATMLAGGGVRSAQIATMPLIRPLSWLEAAPIVAGLPGALPPTLAEIPEGARPDRWPSWVAEERSRQATRLAQGEEDSLVNLLLFGTSFTREDRITVARLEELDRRWRAGDTRAQAALLRTYRRRAADLVSAISTNRGSERLRMAREVLERAGYDLKTLPGRHGAGEFLLQAVVRVRQEAAQLARDLAALRERPDSAAATEERSRIFRDRGLASDSSVLTQFAVDAALCTLRDQGALRAAGVGRVAVVGPGLDFIDKQEGLDVYEPQSLQPFTVIDSLLACGLGDEKNLQVTTIDISPRVNRHMRRALDRADRGQPYRLVLPRDTASMWSNEAVTYWERAGARVGLSATARPSQVPPTVRLRAILVNPSFVRRLHVLDADIVFDRLAVPGAGPFDLVIATNILVYYDRFHQTLALSSIASMLRPGGLLLTNDAVAELPEIPMRATGSLAVPFSERVGDGERMVWYVKASR